MENQNIKNELDRVMLEYYSIKLNEEKQKLEELDDKKTKEEKIIKDLYSMWDKFHNLNDNKVIEDISKILKQEIDNKGDIYFSYDHILIKEYFMNKNINIELIFSNYRLSEKIYDYFLDFGFSEKMRWEKIKNELEERVEFFKKEKNREDFEKKIEKFVNKAIDMELIDVSNDSIKNIAHELKEDVNNITKMLTLAVSVRLRKHYGNQPRAKRKGITKSIRVEIFKRDNYVCQNDGQGKEVGLHVHHIIPESLGGTDEMDNLITLCADCNESIGNRKYNPTKSWIGYKIYPKWKKLKGGI